VLTGFALAVFWGAFLLFLVQPLFARLVLPVLGGSPSVWNVAMVFYQFTLLLGYGYAHLLTRQSPKTQRILHLGLCLLPLVVLPLALPADAAPPADRNPTGWLLLLLASTVGLPFLAVSTTNPLLQRWFASTAHRSSADPYFLSAASNLGSLLALLSYPLWIERFFELPAQSQLWTWGYGLWILLLAACALAPKRPAPSAASPVPAPEKIPFSRIFRWLLLAFVPASLMMSVTTWLTTEIGSAPLLWIIPLSLYLLSFVPAFARRPWFSWSTAQRAVPLILTLLAVALVSRANHPPLLLFSLHLAALFLISTVCHGQLAADRPPPEHLTAFYFWMSLGGVLGGAFNALLAPVVFTNVLEYFLTVALAAWLAIPQKISSSRRVHDVLAATAVGLVAWILVEAVERFGLGGSRFATLLMFGPPVLLCFSFSRNPLRFSLALGALFLAGQTATGVYGPVIFAERSFFGIHRIQDDGQYRRLIHGSTLHGAQALAPTRRSEPLAYYARSGPLGQVFAALPERPDGFRVGGIGLGVGSAAAYARTGEDWTFYEIDPSVVRIAENPQWFTFLSDAAAKPRIILGDGRLTLHAAPDHGYHLLILDAYSSDAVPVHLLTREALQLYLQKLAPGGLLLFHVSNRYLDLEPVLAALAADQGLAAFLQNDESLTEADYRSGKSPSRWIAAARQPETLAFLQRDARWQPPQKPPGFGVWTDAHSSLLSALRGRRENTEMELR
jgi:SAM-dependent methyltransferase